jgi:PKD repeat protein
MRRFALLLLGCLLLIAGASADPADPWWDDNWEKRVPLTVTDASATDGIQGLYNVTYDSDMQSNFDDLRFVQDDGSTAIPYWIESQVDGSYARAWVKLPGSDTLAYMYYGNSAAESESDGDAVFVFFDDFNAGSLNTSKWTVVGGYASPTFADGEMRVGYNCYVTGDVSFGADYAAVLRFKVDSAYTNTGYGFGLGSENYASVSQGNLYTSGATNNGAVTAYRTTYDRREIIRNGAVNVIHKTNGAQDRTGVYKSSAAVPVRFLSWASGRYSAIDWLFVRTYTATEPTLSPGTEEAGTTSLSPFPGISLSPQDLNGDGLYTDINGNGRLDYNDLTIFFQNIAWAKTNQPTEAFDFNGNGWLDYNDVITLFTTITGEHP